eukprot:916045_1
MQLSQEAHLPIEPPHNQSSNTSFQTFVLGLLAGSFHVLTGHPFETIKTRLQTRSHHALFRNLFSGISAPLLIVPLTWSIYWSIYSKTKHFTTNYFNLSTGPNNIKHYLNIFMCGAISGSVPCLMICPVDLVKCYAQKYHLSSTESSKSLYNKFMFQNSDVILTSQPQVRTPMYTFVTKGVYRGFVSCLCRDSAGMGMYFVSMELCKNNIKGYNDNMFIPFMTGTCSAIMYWLAAFPGDCIKSQIQTDFVTATNIDELHTASFIRNIKAHVRSYGVRSLYKGFGVIMLRCPIVSGTAIVGVETGQKYIDSFNFK